MKRDSHRPHISLNDLAMIGLARHREPAIFDRVKRHGVREWFEPLEVSRSSHLLLETCERVEIYVASPEREKVDAIADAMPLWTLYRGLEAAGHLFRVASGLDSRILGEKHVRGQVRRMVLEFQRLRLNNPVLSKVGQLAIHVPRLVSRHTRFGAAAVEIDQLATLQVAAFLGSRRDAVRPGLGRGHVQAVVLGTGCIGRRLCQQLQCLEGLDVTVTGRDEARSVALAENCRGRALPWSEVRRHLHEFQVILGATQSHDYLLRSSDFAQCSHPTLVCDLSIPCVVDPAVAERENISYWSMDRLTNTANANSPDLELAESIVAQTLEGLVAWERQRAGLQPVVSREASKAEPWLELRKAS